MLVLKICSFGYTKVKSENLKVKTEKIWNDIDNIFAVEILKNATS